MTERHFFCKRRHQTLFAVLLGLCLLCAGPLLASGRDGSPGAGQHKFYSLTHISPERGKALLSKMGLGTVSVMPGTDALLITAGADDLSKAVALLDIVDVPEAYDVRQVAPAASSSAIPSSEQIASAFGNISVGTFAHPPCAEGGARALIDVHNGSRWVVAPLFQCQDIALAFELGPHVLARRRGETGQVVASAVPQAPQATVTGEPASSGPSVSPARRPSPDMNDHQAGSERITLSDDMQKRLLEMQLRAAERQRRGLAALPPRPLEAERKPSALALDFALAQADAEIPTPSPAAPVGDSSGIPNGRAVLLPGQVVPSESGDLAIYQVAEAGGAEAVPDRSTDPAPSEAVSKPEAASAALPADMPSESAYEPEELLNGDRTVDLTLPEKLEVINLLDLVGKYMNLTYLYDPAKITGEVTLKLNGDLRGSMKVKDLYLLLESVLKFKKLAMTRHKGNVVQIVPIDEALEADPQLVGAGEPPVEAGDVIVTRVFELQHINTTSAQNLLDNMKLSVGVTPIAESDTLIVTAYAHRMARIEQLLYMVDKPGEPRLFRFRQLRYTMAKNLAEKVKALAEQLESVTVTVGTDDTSSTATPAKMPGESEAAYRQRLARLRATQQARARATAATRPPTEEPAKPGVYLDADERTNRILMIGVGEQLGVVDDLVDALDVEQQDLRSMKLYRIRHVDAEEVRTKLEELGIITRLPETTGSSRITGGPRTAGQTPAQVAAARAAAAVAATTTATEEISEEGPVEEPQVVVVEATNSLLVNATPEQHLRIETIIGYVDSETDVSGIPYKVYPLENSSPDHLATVLQSLIQETTQNQDPEGKVTETVTKRREEDIAIVPDPNTYSLIVYASKKNQEWIEELIKKLDKRRPQVLIDVTLVEITETEEFNYDLNVLAAKPDVTVPSPHGLLVADSTRVTKSLSIASGALSAFYGDKHIQALLEAVQSKNYGRVLAKPKILVNDNEPGTIKTTDTTYVRKTSSIPVSGGGAGQDTTLIQTAEEFTPYEAGITLDITPHISEGELLRLDIMLTRSDFLETAEQEKPPNTTASEVATAVTVPDGSTIILGGLLKLNQSKGGKKVPILGDLPLLGGLFRSIDNSDRQSKLYVFVKAEIIRPVDGVAQGLEDLEKLSERNRLAFEQHEQEFQQYQDWPGIKAKPVGPAKVLDAQ